jgi:hypothetical protein
LASYYDNINFKSKFTNIIRYYNLIFLIFLVLPLSGQQTGSAPVITWENPSIINSKSNSSIVTIKAKIVSQHELQNVQISVNNIFVQFSSQDLMLNTDSISYSFEKRIQLKPGKSSIYILAANAKGVTYSSTRVINYFFGSAPVITLINPSARDSINVTGTALVKAEIVSHTALQMCWISQNGKVLIDETGEKPVQIDSITYILEKRFNLRSGLNTIFIEARNTIGTGTSEKRSIIFRREPIIKWILPFSINTANNSGIFNIKAEIKTPFELQSAFIDLNGTILADEKGEITRLNEEAYIFEKTIQLSPGKNSIFLTAGNAKGVAYSTSRFISYLLPVVTLISPSVMDSLNTSGSILVRAEIVSKPVLQKVMIFLNGKVLVGEPVKKHEQKDSITYLIESLLPLKVGLNTIYIEAKNSLGTSGSEKHKITWQLEPFVIWVYPSSVYSSSQSGMLDIKANIKTKFDLQKVRINLNDTILPDEKGAITRLDNDTYMFERTIQLNPGENKVFLDAGNAKGIGYSNKLNISYMPGIIAEIKWIAPVNSSTNTYKSEFPISANIKTKAEIKNTHLYLNGTELLSGNKLKTIRKNAQECLYENVLTLKPGTNTIELSAITDAGTINSEKRIITYTFPVLPVLAWKNPFSDHAEVNQALMNIRMNIKSGEKLDSIAVYLNGEALDNIRVLNSVKKENEDFILGSTLVLKPGDNTIYVAATNVAGTVKSEARNIKYLVPSMPVIEWGNPETSVSNLSTSIITIAAIITSTTDLKNLRVFHDGNVLSGVPTVNIMDKLQGVYRVEETINLNQGENRIYLVAENLAGNSTSETRLVNYVTPSAPDITWISPSRQYNDINLNSAKIRATVKSSEKLQSLLVYVNGTASEKENQITTAGPQGEYTLEKAVNLQPGENNIYIVASNINGTNKSEIRYLTNPPTNPPVISWAVPVDPKAIVNSEVIVIEACIKSATELKSAQIYVNGVQQASEMMFQAPQPGDCNYRLNKQVILKEGDNSVFIIASNFAGSTNSERRLIRFETTLIAEKRLALIIGNADYGSSNVLQNPVNDANLIEGTLKSLGFEVIKRTNATKNEMMESLRDFSKKLPEYNVALFYYAGHGIQVDGQNYLIPVDAILKEKTDCKWEAMPVNYIVEEFERVPDNINIVILDACRNNPFRSWVRGGEQGFRAVNPVSGTIVSFATSEGSTAADGSGSNGTFTEELVKQIVIPQTISSVFINTRREVMKRTNNTQRPQEWNMLTGEFYFKK